MHDLTTLATPPVGPIRGLLDGDVARFAGIPYAQPPLGDLRFRPAVPVADHTGEIEAMEFGRVAPQNPSIIEAAFGGDAQQWDEDCLTLNIWTPAHAVSGDGEGRPVMVWIHGGGFEMGSGSSPMYTGDRFAREGVVLVTLNYRLGPLGFLELGSLADGYRGSGNAGLTDQLCALEWVQRNIAAFGGNPDNVTVFGQSAGAMSVSLLMATTDAGRLFHKAIVQSGSPIAARSVDQAALDTADFMRLGGFTTVDELRSASVADLLAAHAAVGNERLGDPEEAVRRTGSTLAMLPTRPVADGGVVPVDPSAAIAEGSAAGVALLTGTTSEEWKLFSFARPAIQTNGELRERVALLSDNPDETIAAYQDELSGASVADIEVALLSDVVFRLPALEFAAAQRAHAPVYMYRWEWQSPAWGGAIGAAHAIEIPFVFDMVEDHRLHVFVGADAPAALAHATNQAWIEFARSGVPSAESLLEWPEWETDRFATMILADGCRVENDPAGITRRHWQG